MGNGTGIQVPVNLSESEGFFDRKPHAIMSQLYNTDVANISGRYHAEHGPVPDSEAGICA
jgi:hypothetical protein